jgi:putative membrane protein
MKVVTLWAVCMLFATATVVAQGTSPDSTDQNFVRKAAEGGMLEVKLGELAMRRGKSQKVKDFGKTMVSDHQKVNNELKDLAARGQITVPATISKSMQQQYDSPCRRRHRPVRHALYEHDDRLPRADHRFVSGPIQ